MGLLPHKPTQLNSARAAPLHTTLSRQSTFTCPEHTAPQARVSPVTIPPHLRTTAAPVPQAQVSCRAELRPGRLRHGLWLRSPHGRGRVARLASQDQPPSLSLQTCPAAASPTHTSFTRSRRMARVQCQRWSLGPVCHPSWAARKGSWHLSPGVTWHTSHPPVLVHVDRRSPGPVLPNSAAWTFTTGLPSPACTNLTQAGSPWHCISSLPQQGPRVPRVLLGERKGRPVPSATLRKRGRWT